MPPHFIFGSTYQVHLVFGISITWNTLYLKNLVPFFTWNTIFILTTWYIFTWNTFYVLTTWCIFYLEYSYVLTIFLFPKDGNILQHGP